MLQFVPSENTAAASSTGNAIVVQDVSISDLNANPNDYESEYIRLSGVTIDNTASATWATNLEYPMTNADGTFTFRTTFFEADYIGDAVPTTVADVSGIITERNNGSYFITARNSADIDADEVAPTEVATLADLRAGSEGVVYTLTGEAILTFQQDFRNQKFIEDATGAILIDDSAETITTAYNIGDGIIDITGTLSSFQGMLQFTPVEDPGAAFSTGNTITPQQVTVTELMANPNDYESEFVVLTEVDIDNTTNADWITGTEYALTTPDGTYNFRTTFFDADYIGQPVPTETQNISGIITERNDGDYYITSRSLADFEEFLSVAENNLDIVSIYPNPASDLITITTGEATVKNVTIFEISGKKVVETTTANPIQVSQLAAGIYIVKVSGNTKSMTSKLIIK